MSLFTLSSAWNVADPSWSEISNFIKFLAHQLNCCEKSYYCSDKYSLPGFKEFVTSFVIEMSKVKFTLTLFLKASSSLVPICLFKNVI